MITTTSSVMDRAVRNVAKSMSMLEPKTTKPKRIKKIKSLRMLKLMQK